MEWLLGGVIFLLGILLLVLVVFLFQGAKSRSTSEVLKLMQEEINSLRTQVSQEMISFRHEVSERLKETSSNLQETNKNIGTRLDNAYKAVTQVESHLAEVKEANERIYQMGKDLLKLEELFRSPRIRGGIGEFLLKDLLSQILPAKFYSLQYSFRSGEKVDAVIKLANGLVPVDSKFPLEDFRKMLEAKEEKEKKSLRKNFLRIVKGHIDAIAQKYILPDEGTFDFALMYIPAENVYYETIIRDDFSSGEKGIMEYTLEKRVIPVSPNSFYAYLQAIVLGLKGLHIEKTARQVMEKLARLNLELKKFRSDFSQLGEHLRKAYNKYGEGERALDRFSDKLLQIEETKQLEEKQN